MSKLIAVVFPLAISLFAIVSLSCDDYNIVEPRFYSKSEITEIPACYRSVDGPGGIDTTIVGVAGKIIPSDFSLQACWIQRDAGELAVWYALPIASHAEVSILRSSGAVEVLLADSREEAGTYLFTWVAQENGVYGMSMQTRNFKKTIWFEVDMAVE